MPDESCWGHRLAGEKIEGERDYALTIALWKVPDRADQPGPFAGQFGVRFGRRILADYGAMLFSTGLAECLQSPESAGSLIAATRILSARALRR